MFDSKSELLEILRCKLVDGLLAQINSMTNEARRNQEFFVTDSYNKERVFAKACLYNADAQVEEEAFYLVDEGHDEGYFYITERWGGDYVLKSIKLDTTTGDDAPTMMDIECLADPFGAEKGLGDYVACHTLCSTRGRANRFLLQLDPGDSGPRLPIGNEMGMFVGLSYYIETDAATPDAGIDSYSQLLDEGPYPIGNKGYF
jgi:hypothetical protein